MKKEWAHWARHAMEKAWLSVQSVTDGQKVQKPNASAASALKNFEKIIPGQSYGLKR